MQNVLHLFVIQHIHQVPFLTRLDVPDVQVWKGQKDGISTARSFFQFLSSDVSDSSSDNWSWVWKIACP